MRRLWSIVVPAVLTLVVIVAGSFAVAQGIASDLTGGGTPPRAFWIAVVFTVIAALTLASFLVQRSFASRVHARASGPVLLVRPNGELRDLLLHRGTSLSIVNGSLRGAPRFLAALSFDADGVRVWNLGGRECGVLPWDALTSVEGTTLRENNRDALAVGLRSDGGIMAVVVVIDSATGTYLRDSAAIDTALEPVPVTLRSPRSRSAE